MHKQLREFVGGPLDGEIKHLDRPHMQYWVDCGTDRRGYYQLVLNDPDDPFYLWAGERDRGTYRDAKKSFDGLTWEKEA